MSVQGALFWGTSPFLSAGGHGRHPDKGNMVSPLQRDLTRLCCLQSVSLPSPLFCDCHIISFHFLKALITIDACFLSVSPSHNVLPMRAGPELSVTTVVPEIMDTVPATLPPAQNPSAVNAPCGAVLG